MWSDAARQAALGARQANAKGIVGNGIATEPQTPEEFGAWVRHQHQELSDKDAATALAQGGAKSAPVPVHSSAVGRTDQETEDFARKVNRFGSGLAGEYMFNKLRSRR